MMGKKTDMEVVTVMMKLCHKGHTYVSSLIGIVEMHNPLGSNAHGVGALTKRSMQESIF